MNYCKTKEIECPFALSGENSSLTCIGTQEMCDKIFKLRSGEYRVFIICSVRGTTDEYKKKLEKYVHQLEEKNIQVHLPHRDTNQNNTGYLICQENANAIKEADEVHIFYNSKSQGTHFDMGVAFALNKNIFIVENEEVGEGKSFPKMLTEWEIIDKS